MLKKNEFLNHKNKVIKKLDKYLEHLIAEDNSAYNKKADLISYWLDEFTQYLQWEETFTPSKLIRYSRGDVIRVNFGFNIGKEMGGLHYAVVIEKENHRNSHVVSVLPLSSTEGKKIYKDNVDLGTELYSKVSAQHLNLINQTNEMIEQLEKILSLIDEADLTNIKNEILKSEFENKLASIRASLSRLEYNEKEIKRMKKGSMVVMNQITTISKLRIYTPKKSEDFLYGIKLSASALDKINIKLKEIFIF
nr:MAG TPA: PemK-like protein [Caudoviricetes sp.]